jgi:radical SAM protein with 4Fe4S-binding SPASM domain
MKWELYTKIIDEASAEGCYGCKYHTIGRGEPLLNQNLVRMVQYAKKKGLVDVYLNTNATLLRKDLSKALLDAGLDRISFSVDGEKVNYNETRPGADFIKVLRGISDFYNLRQDGDYDCGIRIQTVDLPDLNFDNYGEYWIHVADEVSMIDFKDMTKRERGLKGKWICPQPWQRMSVLFNGDILPCNHDDRLYAKLGNMEKTSLRKVWHSNAMNFIRNSHKTNNAHLLSACDGCYLRTSEINKEGI